MTTNENNESLNPISQSEIAIEHSDVTGLSIAHLSLSDVAKPIKSSRWTKLESIEIKNFKAIETIEIPLTDVTILVGPNGSGKSSVLQGIHWAARAASYIAPKNTKEVVAFDRLDYLPSSEPLKTSFRSELSSDTGTPPTQILFKHSVASDETPSAAKIKIWAARNKGGISVHIEGGQAVTPFKQRQEFITAYIPGLAGLSEKETMLVQPLLRRQAASGDAGGVLRNLLFNLASRLPGEKDDKNARQRLTRLNQLVQSVHPKIVLKVGFDDREDVNIQASFGTLAHTGGSQALEPGSSQTLETAATGILQVVQIFAYLILFRPKLLLVDEPDAHLHPDKQERLIEALELSATEFQTQIILTTHSPHIIRAASSSTNLIWVKDGKRVDADDSAIRRLLGWGGLDKKCLFFVEDEDDKVIRALLRQWPQIQRQISICRCFGIDNLPRNKLLEGLMQEGDLLVKVLIHRDRDFMTEEECLKWNELYGAVNTFTWCTFHVDTEAYFCQPEYLARLYEVSLEQANEWITAAVLNINGARDLFFQKRKVINSLLYRDGGSPSSEALWDPQGKNAQTVLGKHLLAALKPIIKTAGKDDKLLHHLEIPLGITLAPDLKAVLETVLSS
ncbi:MAG: ATP-dependent endonuclease [Methylophilaceae bacterium]